MTEALTTEYGTTTAEIRSRRNPIIRFLESFRRYPIISVVIIGTLLVVGIFAPFITTHDPDYGQLRAKIAPPFWNTAWYDENPRVETRFLLGADGVGRDIFSRMVDGARISLIVMAVSLASGMFIGTTLGLVSGYFGGMIDEIITRIWDIWAAIPFLLIALIIATVVGNSLEIVIGLLAMVSWSSFVRNVRAETFTLRERDYVAQAKIAGASAAKIMWRHILPNTINTVVVIATLRVGGLILAEASLSFLGVGIPKPQATWGNMVADGRAYLSEAWWIAFFPGLAIFLTVMALNFLGDWLRDRWDPRLRQI